MTRKIKAALKDIIDNEDKRRPLSDDAIKDKMNESGYPVARRTIANIASSWASPSPD